MNNVFVSYEVASELKELGFDESCFGYYDCERDFKFLPDKSKFLECEFAAPTFSHVFKFFREKYNYLLGYILAIMKNFTLAFSEIHVSLSMVINLMIYMRHTKKRSCRVY